MKFFTTIHLKTLIILTVLCAFTGCAQQIKSIPERSPDTATESINEQPRNTKQPVLLDLDDIPTTPVRYKSKVELVYPDEARLAKKGGEVVIQLIVDENGMPKDIKPITHLGYRLEEAAIEAIQKTTFYPAMQGKRPVRKKIEITYRFSYETLKK